MFLTTHAVLGAIAGEFAPHPAIAFFMGIVTHLLSDMIPHGDSNLYENYKNKSSVAKSIAYVVIDAIISIFVVIWMFTSLPVDNAYNRAFGILGGLLPDLLVGLSEFVKFSLLSKFVKLHFYFHNFFTSRYKDISLHEGLTLQMFFLVFLIHELTIVAQ